VESAASTLKNMMDRTGEKIPPEILSEAEAVAIFPEVTKVGVVVGGRYGSGALMLQQNGQWNGPVFLSLYGASVGAQLGVEQTDLIMIFNNRESIRELQDGALEFGAEASVAAGPYGEYAKASTQADILAYKQTEGAFAGIALSSGYIAIDNESNRR
jgi:lipid-binding SYLF domain-containing protein